MSAKFQDEQYPAEAPDFVSPENTTARDLSSAEKTERARSDAERTGKFDPTDVFDQEAAAASAQPPGWRTTMRNAGELNRGHKEQTGKIRAFSHT